MIRPVGTVPGAVAGVRRGGGAVGAFRLPAGAAQAAPVAGAAAAAGLDGLLALQELPQAGVADREARRHAADLLMELARLQRALLGDGAPDLARLAGLAAAVPAADDPGLAATVAAVALRARIELARLEVAADD